MRKNHRTMLVALLVTSFTLALAGQVIQTRIESTHLSWKRESPLLRIKSGGEVVAELQILRPVKLKVAGGVEISETGTLRTHHGAVEISPEGISPWRISGVDLDIEIVEKKPDPN